MSYFEYGPGHRPLFYIIHFFVSSIFALLLSPQPIGIGSFSLYSLQLKEQRRDIVLLSPGCYRRSRVNYRLAFSVKVHMIL